MNARRVLRGIALLLAAGCVLAVVTALLLEGSLRIAQAAGFVNLPERPSETHSFYEDRDPHFGVWHPPNSFYRATRDCFDVVYESNSYGARDRERAQRSAKPRVLVLGDSFVEGVGVESQDRLTDRLERATGVEHLNFGTAGNFSSVQQWLLYKELASKFDHDLVLLFTLPNNDFLENDPERWWQPDRYRPYLRAAGDGFELFYPIDFATAQENAAGAVRRNRLHNASFAVRFYNWADTLIRVRRAEGQTTPFGYVGYVNFTNLDLERLFFSYRKLRDAAGGRELVVFTIPRLNDLLYYKANGKLGGLAERISEFAAQEPNIRYFDLLPGYVADAKARGRRLEDYFLPCDGHWSPEGHDVATRIVLESLKPLPAGEVRDAAPNDDD
jgi:lysophospholipase L1-like esterase